MFVILGFCHKVDEKCTLPGYCAVSSSNFLPIDPFFKRQEFLTPEDVSDGLS
jgi:hypothetical protein